MTSRPGLIRRFAVPAGLLLLAAGGAGLAARVATDRVEAWGEADVAAALDGADAPWATPRADGQLVAVTGEAPDEASRFRALAAAATAIEASRLVDAMTVANEAPEDVPPPPYAVEILRTGDDVALFGLIPDATDRDALLARAGRAAPGEVRDLLDSADGPVPEGWEANLARAFDLLGEFDQAKISLTPGTLAVTATVPDQAALAGIERDIRADVPDGIELTLSLSAPRPVISPFALRAAKTEDGTTVSACAATADEGRSRIAAAADRAGAADLDCPLGLGAPSPDWSVAAAAGLDALAELPAGRLTLTDTAVTLTGEAPTDEAALDAAAQTLSGALPDGFVLETALALPPPDEDEGDDPERPPRFSASRTEDGARLRGRLGDPLTRAAVESFGRARFGADAVEAEITDGGTVPEGWPVRVLAGLEALSVLNTGDLLVLEDQVSLSGRSGAIDAPARIAAIFADQLGPDADVVIDIEYVEELDPTAALPTPEECIRRIGLVVRESPKITFAPGSTDIEESAFVTIDALADILRDCTSAQIEIGGHTDSQGRESMNLNLSQARANSVLNAIMARRVLTSNLTAKGYGEAEPIADNGTEAGREDNRRIEFTLVGGDDDDTRVAEADTGDAETATDSTPDATDADADADPDAPEDEGADEAADEGEGEADETEAQAQPAERTDTTGARRIRVPGGDTPLAQVPVEIEAQTPDDDTPTPRPRPEQDE